MKEMTQEEIRAKLLALDDKYKHLEKDYQYRVMKLRIVELEMKLVDARESLVEMRVKLAERGA